MTPDVRALQERAARAVAAAVHEDRDGDLLRHTDSPTTWWAGAALLHGRGDLPARVAAAEAFADEHGAPPRFQVCPACPPWLDGLLAARGYRRSGDVHLQTAPAVPAAPPALPVRLHDRPTAGWAALLAAAQGPGTDAAAELRLVERVSSPSAYATAHLAGSPVAVGRAVADEGWAGVFGMATLPAARRRGAAAAVLAALAGWAAGQGCPSLYLQVTGQDEGAARLYARAGFRTVATYHYRH